MILCLSLWRVCVLIFTLSVSVACLQTTCRQRLSADKAVCVRWTLVPRGYVYVQIKNIDAFKVISTHLEMRRLRSVARFKSRFRYVRFVRWLLMVTVTLRAYFDLLLFEWKWEVPDFSFEYCTELFKNDKNNCCHSIYFFLQIPFLEKVELLLQL